MNFEGRCDGTIRTDGPTYEPHHHHHHHHDSCCDHYHRSWFPRFPRIFRRSNSFIGRIFQKVIMIVIIILLIKFAYNFIMLGTIKDALNSMIG